MTTIVSIKLAVTASFATAILAAFAFSSSTPYDLTAPVDPAQGNGAAIYANSCARCHGDDGDGDKGPALHGKGSTASIIRKVANGGRKMPSFKSRLSAAEIKAVANYVRTL